MTKNDRIILAAVAKAQEGVDFSPKNGAVCPLCGKRRIPVVSSPPWEGEVKIRYHRCNNPKCVLSRLGTGIKSVQFNAVKTKKIEA